MPISCNNDIADPDSFAILEKSFSLDYLCDLLPVEILVEPFTPRAFNPIAVPVLPGDPV